jgi:hypothetical protein
MATKPEDLVKIYITAAKSIVDRMKAQPDHFLKDIEKIQTGDKIIEKINRRRGPQLGNVDYIYVFPKNIKDTYIDTSGNLNNTTRAITFCVKDSQIKDCDEKDKNRNDSLLFNNNNEFNMIKDNSYYQRDTMLSIVKDLVDRALDIIIGLAKDAPDKGSSGQILGDLLGGRKTRKSKK